MVAICVEGDRHAAVINARRQPLVELLLGVAGLAAQIQSAEIQETQGNGFLDLVDISAA